MKKILVMVLVVMAVFSFGRIAFAEDDAPGVAGCGAIAVDPSSSLEFQQSLCGAAENDPSTSCAVSGHGTCSSPKLNDTLPSGTHCLCISETSESEDSGSEDTGGEIS